MITKRKLFKGGQHLIIFLLFIVVFVIVFILNGIFDALLKKRRNTKIMVCSLNCNCFYYYYNGKLTSRYVTGFSRGTEPITKQVHEPYR